MHVYLGADHNGFELKSKVIEWLASRKITFTDFGAIEYDGEDDFNDYARKVAEAVLRNNTEGHFGVLICGSGQGMCMQANRYKGIRAALCRDASEVYEPRGHDHANVLCIPANTASEHFAEILDAFLSVPELPDAKYQCRVRKLDED